MNRVDQRPFAAFVTALTAVAILSLMDAMMKHLVLVIGIFAVSVWRSMTSLGLGAILYLPQRKGWPARKTLAIHVARGFIVTVMAFLFFWGIGRVPLAQAIALTFIAPLISLLLAALFLKERIGPRSIGGSLAAFAGVVVIVVGQARTALGHEALLGIAAIIGSALTYAVNIVMMRHQAMAAKPLEINFFQSLTILALWVIAVALLGVPAWPKGQWLWILAASLLSSAGTLLFAWAYARGEASYLAVTEYSAFIWASICGWLFFREHVSGFTVAGALLIVGGCLVAARGRNPEPPEMDYT